MFSRFFIRFVPLLFWLNILYFATEIEAEHFQDTEITLSPYTCPKTHGKIKRQTFHKAPPAKRITIRKGATRTDCWYYIIQKINELPRDGRILVVTDIDNTLIKKASHPDGDTFIALPAAVEAMSWLQSSRELDVIALTARPFRPHDAEITEKNLESASIRLLLPDMNPVLTKEQSEMLLRKHRNLHFRNNILYAPSQEKVQALKSFLSVKSTTYRHIVFIDDLIENCEYVLHHLGCNDDKVTVFHFIKPRKSQCHKKHSHVMPPIPTCTPESSPTSNNSTELQLHISEACSDSTLLQMTFVYRFK